MINLLSGLYNIDVSNHSSYLGSICKEMVNGIPGVIFSSILIYDDNDKKVIYQEIECMESKKNEYDKVKLTNLLNENIFLDVDNSVSGKLIKSDKKYLKINDVLQDSDYQSVELAKLLGFKKGIFLKINNVRKKNVYGLVALYPDEKSAVNYWSHLDLCIIISVLESIISNAKLIREDEILYKIFSSAINKDKHDLSDFLSECVDIIISEISAKGCSIFVLDPIDNLIRLKASLGVRPGPKTKTGINGWDFNNVYYKIGEGVTGRIVKNKEVVVDKNFDTSNSKWIDVGLNKNFVGVPILSVDQEKAIGVIRCTTKPNKLLDNTVESFNQEDADLLIYVAKLISMFMEVYFYKENERQLLTKMPHELTASLRHIQTICDYVDLLHDKAIESGLPVKSLRSEMEDIRQETNLSLMTIGSVSAFDTDKDGYDFLITDIFDEVISKVCKVLQPIAFSERNICIQCIEEIKFPQLYIDKLKIQAVFHNLIMNAIKYSYKQTDNDDKYSIIVKGYTDEIDGLYRISVSNYGIGIPFEKKDNIFINGIRAIEAISIDPGGKGFGLALVKHSLNMHGAKIGVVCLKDPTIFEIVLPIEIFQYSPNIKRKTEIL